MACINASAKAETAPVGTVVTPGRSANPPASPAMTGSPAATERVPAKRATSRGGVIQCAAARPKRARR